MISLLLACATPTTSKLAATKQDPKASTTKKPRLKGVGPRSLRSGPKKCPAGANNLKAAKKLATAGDMSGAIAETQKAIEINPNLVQAYLLLGSLLDLQGQSNKAVEVYKSGIAAGVEAAALYHALGMIAMETNQIQDAIDSLSRADEKTRPPSADLKADLAYAHLLAGNTKEGLKFSTQACELNPKSFAAVYTQGEAYFRLKESRKAIRSFASALKLAPKETSAQRRLGQALNQAGEYEQAKDVFVSLLKKKPKDVKSHVALAGVWLSLKRPKDAVKSMELTQKLAPNNLSVLERLAHTYTQAGMKKKARAIQKKIARMESKK
jgi:tetratricopeptide (TPR) repeat protein